MSVKRFASLVVLMFCCSCLSQTNMSVPINELFKPNRRPFVGVIFKIFMTNSVVSYNVTNYVDCKIVNLSSNKVMRVHFTQFYLTNSSGQNFRLPKLKKPPQNTSTQNTFHPIGSALTLNAINAGGSYEWQEPFIVSSNIQSGRYELYSAEGIITPDSKYSWVFISNRIKVEIVHGEHCMSTNSKTCANGK